MNRCLRSLSCFFTLAGLAIFSTDATARPSHKPHAQKAHEATKKSHVVKEARPHRSAASGKNRQVKHASAQRKAKPSKAAPAPKEAVAVAPLTGDIALVKEAIDLARKAKTQEATDIRNKITDPAAQKLVEWYILRHPETTAHFQPLRGVHRRQSAMAERAVAAPARRGAAVGAAHRCGDGPRLHRRPARQCQGQVGAGTRAARRWRSRRRGQAGARCMAVGRIVGAPGDRRVGDVPRSPQSR